jgi:hypothetical protein
LKKAHEEGNLRVQIEKDEAILARESEIAKFQEEIKSLKEEIEVSDG